MDSSSLLIRHSREASLDEGPPKSRPPPDGHEFPLEFQDPDISAITDTLKKSVPIPRPRQNVPNRDAATGKPPLWSRRDEKSETSVRAKIALFSSDESLRLSPVRLARSPNGDGSTQRLTPTPPDLSRSVDNLSASESAKRVASPQPLVKSRRSLQEKSQSLLDVASATLPRRSVGSDVNRNGTERKFSSLLESRQKSMTKLKGLVIPDIEPVPQPSSAKLDLPEIISTDSVFAQDKLKLRKESSQKRTEPMSHGFSRNNSLNALKSQNLSTVQARLHYLNDSGIQERDADTDTDSAVSSSRSSMSPPPSPPPHFSDFTVTPDKDEPRVLKPDSVEALNRRNVLESARFRNGAKSDDELPHVPSQPSRPTEPPQKELEIKVAYVTDFAKNENVTRNVRRSLRDDAVPPVPSKRSSIAKPSKDDLQHFTESVDEVDKRPSDGFYRITRTSSFSKVEGNRSQSKEVDERTLIIEPGIVRASSFSKKDMETPKCFSSLSTRSLNERKISLESLNNGDGSCKMIRTVTVNRTVETSGIEARKTSSEETLRGVRLSPVSNRKSADFKLGDRRSSFSREVCKSPVPATWKAEEVTPKADEPRRKIDDFNHNVKSDERSSSRYDSQREELPFRKRDSPSPASIRAIAQRFEQINTDKSAKSGKPLDNRTASVSDIRRAFEKAEKSLSNADDVELSPTSQSPPTSLRRMPQQPHGIFTACINISPTHARMSSMDSTTSEDSSLPNMNFTSVRDHFGSITSLASTTSLISPQELQQLIDDANQSLEESGTPCHEIVVVVLHRGDTIGGAGSMSLGITLAGGADHEMKEITVHKIIHGSVADRDGRIQRGDRVLSVNGRSLKGVTHREALQILKAPRPEVVLVLSRSRSSTPQESTVEDSVQPAVRTSSISPLFTSSRPPKILESPVDAKNLNVSDGSSKDERRESLVTTIYKDGSGLGFSLEGGKDSPLGDKPLSIKKIFAGGAAAKCGILQVGDHILAVNGHDIRNMSRLEAWNLMKKLPDGEVQLTVAQLKN